MHLGTLCGLNTGKIDNENDFENEDEKNFIFNVNDGQTLVFSDTNDVKYVELVSEKGSFTKVVRSTGGSESRNACPFFAFHNKNWNYSIQVDFRAL